MDAYIAENRVIVSCAENIYVQQHFQRLDLLKKRFQESKTIIANDVSSFIELCDMYIDSLHQKTDTTHVP